jgi:hypothetical protein
MIGIVPIKKCCNLRKDLSLIPKLLLSSLDSGVEGAIDLVYFLVSHKYVAIHFIYHLH